MNNPELRRYAWLELGLHRLIIVPLVLAALVTMVVAVSDHPAEPLAHGALTVFAVLTIGLGALRTYASVIDEVRDRTWDFQRMAAIDPGALAFGKVFGAPLLPWYIGAWCLVVYVAAAFQAKLPQPGATLIGVVALAVMFHSLGVAASALAARTPLAGGSRRFGGVLLLLALLWSLPAVIGAALAGSREETVVHWWLLHGWQLRSFTALSCVMFAAWAAFAAWRAMAREMREPAWWWAWPAFAAFCAFWFAGIHGPATARPRLEEVLALAAAILAAAGYLGLSLDPVTPVSWSRLARIAAGGEAAWHRKLPVWLIHALLAAVIGALALGVALASGRTGTASFAAPASFALALMMLRDAAIVTCFTLTVRARRPLSMATFYIGVADLLVPALFEALGQPQLARAAFPFWGMAEHSLYPAVGMAIHLAVVLAILAFRLKRMGPAHG